MNTLRHTLRAVSIIGVMLFVAISHFGCEEEPSAPESCGRGPYTLDSKTDICRRQSDNAIVDRECCNY